MRVLDGFSQTSIGHNIAVPFMNKKTTSPEQQANNLIAVALMANAVIESAQKPKGHYVLVSKKKLALLREAIFLLKQEAIQ